MNIPFVETFTISMAAGILSALGFLHADVGDGFLPGERLAQSFIVMAAVVDIIFGVASFVGFTKFPGF